MRTRERGKRIIKKTFRKGEGPAAGQSPALLAFKERRRGKREFCPP